MANMAKYAAGGASVGGRSKQMQSMGGNGLQGTGVAAMLVGSR